MNCETRRALLAFASALCEDPAGADELQAFGNLAAHTADAALEAIATDDRPTFVADTPDGIAPGWFVSDPESGYPIGPLTQEQAQEFALGVA